MKGSDLFVPVGGVEYERERVNWVDLDLLLLKAGDMVKEVEGHLVTDRVLEVHLEIEEVTERVPRRDGEPEVETVTMGITASLPNFKSVESLSLIKISLKMDSAGEPVRGRVVDNSQFSAPEEFRERRVPPEPNSVPTTSAL